MPLSDFLLCEWSVSVASVQKPKFLHAKPATALAHLSHRNSVCLFIRLFIRHTGGSVKNGASYDHQIFIVG